MANSIDSNVTGYYIAEEATPGVLPGSPVWYAVDPNSYGEFGATLTKTERKPINQSRQNLKGVSSGIEAVANFNQDLSFTNGKRYMQGFMYADMDEKFTTAPFNSAATTITSVTASSKTYAAASGLGGSLAGSLVYASGFTNSGNNGLKTIASKTPTTIVVSETLTDEGTTPAAAKLETVGYKFPTADAAITVTAGIVKLTSASITLTTLGLSVGEWVFIGGDAAGSSFVNNVGFARIGAIASGYLQFDQVLWTPQAEAATGLTIQIFFGSFLVNQTTSADIVRRTFQHMRTLGEDADGTMSEYIVGSLPNEIKLNIPAKNKLAVDYSFIGTDYETRTGAEDLKSGTLTAFETSDVYNTSSDVANVTLAAIDTTTSSVTPLFAYLADLTITINNGVKGNDAVGVFGYFDVSLSNFTVTASATAYFSDVASLNAITDNTSLSLSTRLVKANTGIIFDFPLVTANGKLQAAADDKLKLPLELSAVGDNGYTALVNYFNYLPALAA